MLTDKSVTELLDAFASPEPTPGGGSAAALCGALGASLFAMVASLPKTRNATPEDRAALDDARAQLNALRKRLVELVDRDAAAYDAVVAAYRLPKGTDAEKASRKAAIQAALQRATEVPVDTLAACREALGLGGTIAEHGNPSAVSDIAVAVQTLLTGIQGAWVNIGINLQGLTDQGVVDAIVEKVQATQIDPMALYHTYQSSGLIDLMRKTAERLGPIALHPPPPGEADAT
jgi:formiminotetrahydrofolate cyclodeaminase